MKFQKETHIIAGQSDVNVKTSQKHDVNLQKNSTLYFQVGLILVLLMVYGLFEMRFETQSPELVTVDVGHYEDFDVAFQDYVIEKDPVLKEKPKVKEPAVTNPTEFDVKENDSKVKEAVINSVKPVEVPVNSNIINDVNQVHVEEPEEDFNIISVEKVPVFPGCEGEITNEGRRMCMSKKLNKFIQKKFNGDLAPELGLEGRQRIDVQFKIDKTGHVIDVKARAPHNALQKEAQRVINKLPKMTPGQQGGKLVNVKYSLPIIFSVE